MSKRITQPGKFEGELDYVPFYWDQALEGFGEDIYDAEFETQYTAFTRLAPGTSDWPDFEADVLMLHESDQGFVHSTLLSNKEFDEFIAELEKETDQ